MTCLKQHVVQVCSLLNAMLLSGKLNPRSLVFVDARGDLLQP